MQILGPFWPFLWELFNVEAKNVEAIWHFAKFLPNFWPFCGRPTAETNFGTTGGHNYLQWHPPGVTTFCSGIQMGSVITAVDAVQLGSTGCWPLVAPGVTGFHFGIHLGPSRAKWVPTVSTVDIHTGGPVGASAVSAGSALGPTVGVSIWHWPPHEGTIEICPSPR